MGKRSELIPLKALLITNKSDKNDVVSLKKFPVPYFDFFSASCLLKTCPSHYSLILVDKQDKNPTSTFI